MQQPELFERLIALLIDATVIYLSAQIEAGAEAVMLFDSWAGLLPPAEFRRHVIGPTQAIVAALKARYPSVPIIGFPRLAGMLVGEYAAATGVDGVGLDTSMQLEVAGRSIPPAWRCRAISIRWPWSPAVRRCGARARRSWLR